MAASDAPNRRIVIVVLALCLLIAAGTWLAIERGTERPTDAGAAAPSTAGSAVGAGRTGELPRTDPEEPARSSVVTPTGRELAQPARALTTPAQPGGCRIHGRAVETSNAPVPGLKIWLVPADVEPRARYLSVTDDPRAVDAGVEVTTDTRGEFEFLDVAPGAWLVGPAPASTLAHRLDPGSIAAMAKLVEVRADDGPKEIEIRVQRGLMIRGKVLQPDGAPAAGVWAEARSQEAPGMCLALTDGDGVFDLGPLVSAQYELWADGYDEGTASASVLAFAGDEGVVLRLREGGSFSGRVIDAHPEAGEKIVLFAMRQDVPPRTILSASANAEGSFQFENVAPGRYQVVARTEDGWFATRSGLEVVTGRAASDLALELRQGGRLRLQRKSQGKLRVEIRQDDVEVYSIEFSEPEIGFAVPAARLTIRWTASSRSAGAESVEIRPGAERVVVLQD